jgi:hypothetical protein
MEKIVIVYPVGDGYSYAGVQTVAIEYESIEAFYVHLEESILQYIHGTYPSLNLDYSCFVYGLSDQDVKFFKKHDLPVIKNVGGNYVSYNMPEIYKLEEWFEKKKVRTYLTVKISTN